MDMNSLDQARIGDATLELLRGDITTVAVDAIVNAANTKQVTINLALKSRGEG